MLRQFLLFPALGDDRGLPGRKGNACRKGQMCAILFLSTFGGNGYGENPVRMPWKYLNPECETNLCAAMPGFTRVPRALYYPFTAFEKTTFLPQHDMNSTAADQMVGGCFLIKK